MQLDQIIKFRMSPIVVVFLVLLVENVCIAAEISDGWRKSEVSLDSSATIYLSNIFGSKRGKFRATPESVLDNKDSIDGKFIVAKYRYVYSQPEIDGRGVASDEFVSTELLDCERHFYGTLRQVRKSAGKIVSDHIISDADVMMTETTSPTIDSQLCEFHEKKKIGALNRGKINNPTYNPTPNEKDVDSIINKYSTSTEKTKK